MNDLQRGVWTRLEEFSIDEGTPDVPFERRLARENGWSVGYAGRVIEEYKRFLYLALFAGHPVCPSEEVDQAWHMHMTFTRSYWDRLCKGVLGIPLHHDPSRGGRDEDTKHEDMYAKTKNAYKRVFGAKPPEDIWPPSSKRFDPRARYRRIDVAEVYVVPRAGVRAAAAAAVLIGACGGVAGCATRGMGTDVMMMLVIGVIVMAVVLGLVLARASRRSRRASCTAGSGDGGGGGCAWMWGGMSGSNSGVSSSSDGDQHHGHGHGHGHSGHAHDGGGADHGGHGGHGGDGSGGHGGDGGGGHGCGGGSGCGGGGCGGGGD
jgi:hypothetical protein